MFRAKVTNAIAVLKAAPVDAFNVLVDGVRLSNDADYVAERQRVREAAYAAAKQRMLARLSAKR